MQYLPLPCFQPRFAEDDQKSFQRSARCAKENLEIELNFLHQSQLQIFQYQKTQIIIKESADKVLFYMVLIRHYGEVALSKTKDDASAKETKCKDIQGTLQKENSILKEMLNETENMHLVFLDRDFNFVRVNEAYAKTCGYKPEEMIGKNHFALYPDKEVEAVFKRVRDTGVPAEFHDRPFVFPDQPERGVTYWDWTLKPVKNEAGEIKGLVFSLAETTQRKKAEEALSRSERKYRRLYETSQDGIMARDLQGRMINCNRAYSRMLGYSKKELRTLPVHRLLPEKWRRHRDELYKQIVETGVSKVFERKYSRKDGSVLQASVRSWPLTDDSGKVIGVWSVVRDISEMKKTEEELRRAEWVSRHRSEELEDIKAKLEKKAAEVEEYATHMEELARERALKLQDAERMAAIGETAGMVGHDIRNPLQAIVGDLFLIASDASSLPEGEMKESIIESIQEIRKSVDYIDKIVQDLQDYAKPLKPSVKKTDLEAICQELLLDVSFPENIDAKYLLEEEAKEIVADPALLKRILRNLVDNSVQAMPDEGKLEIQAVREPDAVVISVQDSGVGIPEENKAKLFTPLFTTKSKGQGFGLAVVKRMTEALGGTVNFESEVGKGTKFIVRLPIARK
jgi:PAS domain S-box-containing protein